MISEHRAQHEADSPRRLSPDKSEQHVAIEFAKLSELAGRVVDDLLYGDPSTLRKRTVEAASKVRRIVMDNACAVVGVSADAKGEALVSDLSHVARHEEPAHRDAGVGG